MRTLLYDKVFIYSPCLFWWINLYVYFLLPTVQFPHIPMDSVHCKCPLSCGSLLYLISSLSYTSKGATLVLCHAAFSSPMQQLPLVPQALHQPGICQHAVSLVLIFPSAPGTSAALHRGGSSHHQYPSIQAR